MQIYILDICLIFSFHKCIYIYISIQLKDVFFLAWQFYRHSDSASSRKLFRFSLIHLPLIMILLLLSKKSHTSEDHHQNLLQLVWPA